MPSIIYRPYADQPAKVPREVGLIEETGRRRRRRDRRAFGQELTRPPYPHVDLILVRRRSHLASERTNEVGTREADGRRQIGQRMIVGVALLQQLSRATYARVGRPSFRRVAEQVAAHEIEEPLQRGVDTETRGPIADGRVERRERGADPDVLRGRRAKTAYTLEPPLRTLANGARELVLVDRNRARRGHGAVATGNGAELPRVREDEVPWPNTRGHAPRPEVGLAREDEVDDESRRHPRRRQVPGVRERAHLDDAARETMEARAVHLSRLRSAARKDQPASERRSAPSARTAELRAGRGATRARTRRRHANGPSGRARGACDEPEARNDEEI